MIKDMYYDKFLGIFKKDLFHNFYLIKTEDSYKISLYTVLFKLRDHIYDFLYIYNLDLHQYEHIRDFISKTVFNYYKNPMKNSLYCMRNVSNLKGNTISDFIKNYPQLHQILKGDYKSILDYTLEDIDYTNIYHKKKFLSKEMFRNNYHTLDIDYNFINKIYPKRVHFNNIILDKKCVYNLQKATKTIYNQDIEKNTAQIILSLILFYNSTHIKQNCL